MEIENKENIGEKEYDPLNPPKNCTLLHPPLHFEFENGNEGVIYGSSCIVPMAEADLYISLDKGAKVFEWEQPWNGNPEGLKHVRFFIDDFQIPDDAEQFDACVDLAIEHMAEGKTVHVGCLGGHGRTGMFLSALTQKLISEQLIEEDLSAIDYVRENYCVKAVETLEQVLFLYANYDIKIPDFEEQDIAWIKKEFKKEIGVSLDEVIQAGEFDSCVEVIQELEARLLTPKAPFPLPSVLNKTLYPTPKTESGSSYDSWINKKPKM